MLQLEKEYYCHGGIVSYYSHKSTQTQTSMRFSLFIPSNMADKKIPYIMFLSGLTCTEDNFTTKANAYQKASMLGIAILAPDTSPRGDHIPNDSAYDLGQGASFYLDATQEPWAENFQMESYLIKELMPMVEKEFSLDNAQKSIMGHSMGGHGALILYLKYPELFASCSAFAPIVAPSKVPWGQKAFTAYLGDDRALWNQYDACALVTQMNNAALNAEILIDQGLNDTFLEDQLKPALFQAACEKVGQKLTLRYHEHYDHSYFFIQSYIDSHLEWHKQYL